MQKFLFLSLYFLAGALFVILTFNIAKELIPAFGYRLDIILKKNDYKSYQDKENKLSVSYPSSFTLDKGEEAVKRYGKDYLVGFKHKDDPRIGCEVRKQDITLDLSQSQELFYNQFMSLFGKTANNVKITKSRRVKVGDREGYQFNVTFTDPLNAVEAVNHIFIPQGQSTYMLICGAGKAYFDYFSNDFSVFFNSFKVQ